MGKRKPASQSVELDEVGKVLSQANAAKIKAAHGHLTEVLQSVGSAKESDRPVDPPQADPLSEAYSASAQDAADGVYVQASILRIISDESDEPDQVKMLMAAYDAIGQWIKAEMAEIDTPDDDDQPPVAPYESLRGLIADGLKFRELHEAADSTADINDLPDSAFAYIESGGEKDESGKTMPRSLRHFPIHDAAHVRNALARAPQSPFGDKAMPKIKAAAKKFGVDVSESADLEVGELVMLTEASAVAADGSTKVKVIAPGWGSSGYYAPDVLKRDGSKVFKEGTKMFWDHPTKSETVERPERSLKDLAAVLTSDAKWDETGPQGPGLYAGAKVMQPYREAVKELAPHIGVSIRALGKAKQGSAEGKTGPLIEELTSAHSVDFVTSPGAGGQILQLFEAARSAATTTSPEEGLTVTEQEELAEARREIARLKERNLIQDARTVIESELRSVRLLDLTKNRISESLVLTPPVKDGELDVEALKASVRTAVEAETAYLAAVAGSKPTGFGGATVVTEAKPEDVDKKLAEAFKAMGLNENLAASAAKGRS